MDYEKVFASSLRSEHKKYLSYAMQTLGQNFDRFFVPVAGKFDIVHALIDAGIPKEKIFVSDNSLYGMLLGGYLTGKKVEDLPIQFSDSVGVREFCLEHEEEADKIAHIFYLFKEAEIQGKNFFECIIKRDVAKRKPEHIAALKRSIIAAKNKLSGINFEIKGVAEACLQTPYTDKDFVILAAPATSREHRILHKNEYILPVGVDEPLNWPKEGPKLIAELMELPCTTMLYRRSSSSGFPPEHVYFAKENKATNVDYWIFSKEVPLKRVVKYKPAKHAVPLKGYRLFTDEDTFDENSKVTFLKVKEENALYYRDLFAHRLGDVKAELYFVMLIDDKIVSTVGFNASDVLRGKFDKIFEVYGFSVHLEKYPRINRMMMMCITCEGIKPILERYLSRKNRFYTLNGMRTTCLTKYRKNRLNAGFLKMTLREKLPNGMYRLLYETKYHPYGFDEVIRIYFRELADFQAGRDRLDEDREESENSLTQPENGTAND